MSVYPSLTYVDLQKAIEQLSAAFGLAVHVEQRNGEAIQAASLHWAHGAVMVQPELPDELHGHHAGQGWVYVEVDDLDAHHARALASGVVDVLNDPHDAFDGAQRGYSARDREGNLWSFGSMYVAHGPAQPALAAEGLGPLGVLLGEWTEQTSVSGVPAGRMTFEPLLGGRFVLQHSEIGHAVYPDSWMIVARNDAGDGYTQHYFDARGLARVYAMTFDGRRWTLRRESADFTPLTFAQRFEGLLAEDGRTLTGTWEHRRDGEQWQHDFDVTYTKLANEEEERP